MVQAFGTTSILILLSLFAIAMIGLAVLCWPNKSDNYDGPWMAEEEWLNPTAADVVDTQWPQPQTDMSDKLPLDTPVYRAPVRDPRSFTQTQPVAAPAAPPIEWVDGMPKWWLKLTATAPAEHQPATHAWGVALGTTTQRAARWNAHTGACAVVPARELVGAGAR